MKIHSDILTPQDMRAAAAKAGHGVYIEVATKGSRSRKHAYEFSLTGNSSRRPNSGQRGAGDDYAATWDEWGMVLAHLFECDPNATATYYESGADFHWKTGERFQTLEPHEQCKDHKWEFHGYSVTGSHSERVCKKCSAIQRHEENWT